jgi:hypothetical protein
MDRTQDLPPGALVARWVDELRLARSARDLLEARAVAAAVMRQVKPE